MTLSKKNQESPDVYKCRECEFVGVSKVLSCPRCGSKEYRYYSPLNN